MTTAVALPGGTATLRDPRRLGVDQRGRLQRAFEAAAPVLAKSRLGIAPTPRRPLNARERAAEAARLMGVSLREAKVLLEHQDTAIAILLDSWSLARPLPRTAPRVASLLPSIYHPLAEAVGAVLRDSLAPADQGG